MSTGDVATNQTAGSEPKSDANNQQDQAGSGTDDPKQINGKNVIGRHTLFFSCLFSAAARARARALSSLPPSPQPSDMKSSSSSSLLIPFRS